MCLLFVYLGNWAKQSGNNFYKVILAMNRDERHSIRAVPANFWKGQDSHILAGRDLKSNGSWLGVSKYGKLGSVITIRREVTETDNEEYRKLRFSTGGKYVVSRSSLVPKFLQTWSPTTHSPTKDHNPLDLPAKLSGWEYSTKLCEGPEHRSKLKRAFPFHMLAVDLEPDPSSESSLRATYLSNLLTPDPNAHYAPSDVTPPPNTCDFLAFGNSPSYKPFKKVIYGREEFMDIIADLNCSESGAVIANEQNKISLRDNILDFLRCTKRHLPDPVLREYALASRLKDKVAYRLSSRFVTDFFDIGTRIQSIVLVDTNNNVTFFDWYLERAVYDPLKTKWEESVHEFRLNS